MLNDIFPKKQIGLLAEHIDPSHLLPFKFTINIDKATTRSRRYLRLNMRKEVELPLGAPIGMILVP